MKKDKLDQLRAKNFKEVEVEISKVRKELTAKELEKNSGKLKNVHEVTRLRRDLAQLLTIFAVKKFEEEKDVKNLNR